MNRPRTNDELYELIDRIAERLVDAGRSEWADRIRSSVASGATSGEIFSNLGNDLAELSKSDDATRAGVNADVDLALDLVDEALRRVGQYPPPQ